MAEYDNTNSASGFDPFGQQEFLLQGKMNLEGNERNFVIIKNVTKGGKTVLEVYQKLGVMFQNDGAENAPDWKGPIDDYATNKDMVLSGWKRESKGDENGENKKRFLSIKITEKMGGKKDEIPF
jgi:hypothetical protein|tara:strand:- start:84 stop:455 length:372 start_codon:yes stop_codon:yes gene_type:complete